MFFSHNLSPTHQMPSSQSDTSTQNIITKEAQTLSWRAEQKKKQININNFSSNIMRLVTQSPRPPPTKKEIPSLLAYFSQFHMCCVSASFDS